MHKKASNKDIQRCTVENVIEWSKLHQEKCTEVLQSWAQ